MTVKRRLISIFLAAAVLMSLCTGALAANGLDNFKQQRTYTAGDFKYVKIGGWYEADVKRAYELGLVDGHGNGLFGTEESISLAGTDHYTGLPSP